MKRLIPLVTLAGVLLIPPNSWGIRVTGALSPSGAVSSASQALPGERSGIINGINPSNRTMVIDGVTYIYSSSTVKFHSDDKSLENPLKLREGNAIRFNTIKEPSGKERIVEIWVTRPSANQSK